MKPHSFLSQDLHLLISLLLPLIPVVAWLLLGRRLEGRTAGHLGFGCTALAALALLVVDNHGGEAGFVFTWASFGHSSYQLGFLAAEHGTVMAALAAGISAVVQYFSIGYMSHDRGLGRYYAWLGLFTTAMVALATAASTLTLLMAWELVGISSWGLISFFYQKPAASRAARMALLINKIGDAGLIISVGLLMAYPQVQLLSDLPLLGELPGGEPFPGFFTLTAVGILLAALAKSAQLPLHVWLPQAMAGPTPVSALLHAATMVAAGLFLVARLHLVFELAHPAVLQVTLIIGMASALFASIMALGQSDVKRLLAYSTVAQLGLMFAAVGAGQPQAALAHLYTHAFFKAGLFLSAGYLIYYVHSHHPRLDAQHLNHWAHLRLPLPGRVLMTLFALALAGLPFTLGFLSKETVGAALEAKHPFWAVLFLIVASLTGAYSGRLLAVLWPRQQVNEPVQRPDWAIKNYMVPALVLLALLMLGLNVQALVFQKVPLLHTRFDLHFGWLFWASAVLAMAGLAAGWQLQQGVNAHHRPALAAEHAIESADAAVERTINRWWSPLLAAPGQANMFTHWELRAEDLFRRAWAGVGWLAAVAHQLEQRLVSAFSNYAAKVTVVAAHLVRRFDVLFLAGSTNLLAEGMKQSGETSSRLLGRNLQSYLAATLLIIIAGVIFILL